MKKLFLCLTPLLLASPSLRAADVALGVSLRNDTNSIYLHSDLSNQLRLEGILSYRKTQDESPSELNNSQYTTRASSLGVGLFFRKELHPSVTSYIGSRLYYSRYSVESGSEFPQEQKLEGLEIAPTVGFEYFPIKNVSIGGDIGLAYGRDHGSVTLNGSSSPSKSYELKTVTSLVLRVYF